MTILRSHHTPSTSSAAFTSTRLPPAGAIEKRAAPRALRHTRERRPWLRRPDRQAGHRPGRRGAGHGQNGGGGLTRGVSERCLRRHGRGRQRREPVCSVSVPCERLRRRPSPPVSSLLASDEAALDHRHRDGVGHASHARSSALLRDPITRRWPRRSARHVAPPTSNSEHAVAGISQLLPSVSYGSS